MELPTVIKDHPVLIVGTLAGAGLLFYLLSGSSSSAVTYGGTDPATAQAQASVAAANIAAGAQRDQLQAALQANDENNVLANNIATLQSQTAIQTTQLNDQAGVDIAGINAGVTNNQISAQLAAAQSADDVQNHEIDAGVNIAKITTQGNVANAYYNAQTNINASNNNAAVDAALIASNAAIEQNATNQSASVAKKQSDNGLFGGLLSAGAALLGFL